MALLGHAVHGGAVVLVDVELRGEDTGESLNGGLKPYQPGLDLGASCAYDNIGRSRSTDDDLESSRDVVSVADLQGEALLDDCLDVARH